MRLGSTMREAMMSMMASSDKELEARRRVRVRGPGVQTRKAQAPARRNSPEGGAVQEVGRAGPVDF